MCETNSRWRPTLTVRAPGSHRTAPARLQPEGSGPATGAHRGSELAGSSQAAGTQPLSCPVALMHLRAIGGPAPPLRTQSACIGRGVRAPIAVQRLSGDCSNHPSHPLQGDKRQCPGLRGDRESTSRASRAASLHLTCGRGGPAEHVPLGRGRRRHLDGLDVLHQGRLHRRRHPCKHTRNATMRTSATPRQGHSRPNPCRQAPLSASEHKGLHCGPANTGSAA